MAKEVLVFQGPTSSRSGYGDHARDLVRGLIAMDRFDIKIVDMRWGDCPRNALTTEDVDISSRILTQNLNAAQIKFQTRSSHWMEGKIICNMSISAGMLWMRRNAANGSDACRRAMTVKR